MLAVVLANPSRAACVRTMKYMTLILKLLSPIFILVGIMHLTLGPTAEVLLGAQLSSQSLLDPVLDSQNRFYGVSFALYGALFYLCAGDLQKYQAVLKLVLCFFFAGGIARIVSIFVVGVPSHLVLLLLASELLLPPLLWISLASEK